MTSLAKNNQKLILTYVAFVFLITIILMIINTTPLIKGDLWAEDGTFYFSETFRLGFWDALELNFKLKGYPQLLKYILGYASITITQILFDGNLIYYPQVSAIISYLTYGLVFALPILLFSSILDWKSLYGLPITCCFVVLGNSTFVTFGRILNTGFLSIYFCFMLVAYRLTATDKIKSRRAIFIDILLLVCLFTQPANLFLIAFLYLVKIYNYLQKKENKKEIINLFIVSAGITTYIILVINNGLTKSYGQSGFNESFYFSANGFFGKMMFNNFLGIIYSSLRYSTEGLELPHVIPIFLFIAYVLLIIRYRSQLHWYSLYSLVSVALISVIWRPGLLRHLENFNAGVYAMPTLLISIFLTFSLLSQIIKNLPKPWLANGVCLFTVIVLLTNGIHLNFPSRFQTISLENGLELAEPLSKDAEIYEIPINPDGWSMKLPKEDVEKMKQHL